VDPIEVVRHFIAAVASRDPDAVAACFTPRASFANVPHPPAIGRAAIRAAYAPILARSDRVQWDVHTIAAAGNSVLAERTDRFWIDGEEFAVQCNGVFVIEDELIAELRDYVDLGVWRARLGTVLAPDTDRSSG
jgi:limonene-1,2-epoxide hydrolase